VVGVPPLSTEDALSSGVTIGSEFLVFCVAGGILIYEYNVSEKSNAAKAAVAAKEREEARQRLEDRLCAIDTQLLVLADRLQAVEKSQGELQASSQVGFACTISYERECALVFMKGIVVCFCRAALYHTAGYLACLGQIQLGPVVGLKKVKLLKEPEAAALAHGLNLRIPQLVLVFDLGGGTLDVSVVEVGGGLLEVIATAGDPYLGGDDIDLLIADWLWTQHAQHYGEASSVRAKEDPAARREMLSQARQLKESLSSEHGGVTVPLPSFAEQSNAASVTLTRRALENMCKPLLARMLLPLREVAMAAGINLQGDSAQAGVGGTESHENSSGENDVRSLREIQRGGKVTARLPREVRGDSYRELKRLRGQSQTTNNGGLSMFPAGRSVDALLLVGGATRMPCVRRAVETVTGLVAVSDTRVNPDEAVCLGAGIMAGMLDGVIPGMQVVSHWQSAMLRFLDEEKLKGNDLFPRSS
jgi:hypothetical protein